MWFKDSGLSMPAFSLNSVPPNRARYSPLATLVLPAVFHWGYNWVRHSLFHSCLERSSLHTRVWAAWKCRDIVSKARSVVEADLLKAIFKPFSCLSQHFATSKERTLTWEKLKRQLGKWNSTCLLSFHYTNYHWPSGCLPSLFPSLCYFEVKPTLY